MRNVADASSLIRIEDIDPTTILRLQKTVRRQSFSEALGDADRVTGVVGLGDALEISLWEAQPPTLFAGAGALDARAFSNGRATVLLEQVISADGNINVPFAGTIHAAGRLPNEIEAEIVRRLTGKANRPQVVVRVTRNTSATATVVGDVTQSRVVPLTARGERVLDAIAAAGGVRQAVSKVMIQLTRGDRVQSVPLDWVIQNPRENVVLAPGDVVTAHFQPMSFSVLGASSKNEEINFEAQGISLAQALARSGGLQDQRADARGVFIFRFEEREQLGAEARGHGSHGLSTNVSATRVPIIYRMNLKDPASFLLAQGFLIRNKDVIFISTAPAVELQKFLSLVSTVVLPFQWLNVAP